MTLLPSKCIFNFSSPECTIILLVSRPEGLLTKTTGIAFAHSTRLNSRNLNEMSSELDFILRGARHKTNWTSFLTVESSMLVGTAP